MTRFALLFIAAASLVSAQSYQGGVRGAVRDSTGIIPGAAVTLTNSGTNQARQTATNERGQYVLANVPPGVYALSVHVDGFRPYEQSGIELRVQDFHVIDIRLEIGNIEETVVVTGETPLIDTASASLGSSLEAAEMIVLPTPARNPYYLAITTPNVVPSGNPQYQRMQDQNSSSALSIGGGPRRGNNYTLDGVPITDINNRAVIIPSMESLEEVKVQVSTYDAEMGRTGGGVFNTVHRRGSNVWSGSALIQNRPNWGQGQLYFEKEAGAPKEDSYYWLWGGSFGGAIVPDKTFFWASTEGYRTSVTRNQIITLPTTAMAGGDFSQFDRTIYDPLTTRADPNNPGGFVRDPFPGNVIPSDRIDPVGLSIASFLTGGPPGNSSASANVVDAAEQFSFNLNHEFSERLSASGTYMYYNSNEPFPLFLGGPYDWNNGSLHRQVDTIALNSTYLAGDDSVWTFRYGYFNFDDDFTPPQFDVASLGFSDNYLSQISDDVFPVINAGDYYPGGAGGGNDLRYYSHSVNATWSKFVGNHTIKAGGDYRRIGVDVDLRGRSAGLFDFTEDFTQGPDPTSPASSTGDPIASLLLGYSDFGFLDVNVPREHYVDYVSAFIHDDWRVSESLVLNLGLRMEHEEGVKEKNDLQTVGFDRETPWPIQPIEGMTLRGGLMYAGKNGAPREQGDPTTMKLGPRIGAVWSVDEQTVVRGGYGLFWAPFQPAFESVRGFSARTFHSSSTDGGLTPAGSLSDPFPSGIEAPSGSDLGLLTGAGSDIDFADQFRRSAYVQQFSVDVQRELASEVAVSFGYLGSRSERLGVGGTAPGRVNINQLDPSLQSMGAALLEPVENPFYGNPIFGNLSESETIPQGQLLRPYPQFGDLLALQMGEGKRRYHSMVLRAEKRFRQGWSARVNYTFSRTDDNIFGEGNSFSNRRSRPLDSTDLVEGEWARSITDTPHRANISGIYELPFGNGRRWLDGDGMWSHVLGGWTISAAGYYQSGFPVAVLQIPFNTGVFSETQRPNLVPGIDPGHQGSTIENLDSYLNPDAWSQTEAFTFGDAPRTDVRVRSPFRKNWDLAFQKSATAGAVRTSFRLEIINVFDTPDFDGPVTGFGTRNFGKITNVLGFARTFQFTLRFDW